jgi:coenzyme F420-0:L-glutamate ligase/coenzyme F420-1:gamma-L-glutamate ligase
VDFDATPLDQFLRSRRSLRKFSAEAVPEALVREVLKTATYAPSAHGLQPWRFVLISSPEARQALGETLTFQMRRDLQAENAPEAEIANRTRRSLRRLAEAPEIILVCRDREAVRTQAAAEDLMGIQSVAMAGLQLMLAAHARGLGSNWICWPLYAQAETIRALNLPTNWEPQGMIFLGWPGETPKAKELQPVEAVCWKFYNQP